MFSRTSRKKEPSNVPAKNLTSLPPDLIIKIVQYLSVPDIPQVACASRRFKVLSATDEVYIPKLRALGIDIKNALDFADPEAVGLLNTRLKQLPGGHLLTTSIKYLEQGSLWGSNINQSSSHDELNNAIQLNNTVHTILTKQENGDQSTGGTGNAATVSSTDKISSILPNPKIIIGSGGLKALKKKETNKKMVVGRSGNPSNRLSSNTKAAKELFKQVYSSLYQYYKDFRNGQRESKVFKDHENIIEIAAILSKLRLFGKAKFVPQCDDINFALESAIEWFESTLLGDFESAYDKHDIKEMRKNALASYELNGGVDTVNVFIAKNPIFFDHTFNPSLVASKLPSIGGPAVGYALADEFAAFMDYMLNNCKKQAELVSQVFIPEVDALTLFVNKIFEDSISEYLSAVLSTSKAREGLGIYLHTLATTVYCCTQFLDYILNNPYKLPVNIAMLNSSITAIFSPYTSDYMEKEVINLNKKMDAELQKFNSRVIIS